LCVCWPAHVRSGTDGRMTEGFLREGRENVDANRDVSLTSVFMEGPELLLRPGPSWLAYFSGR
jgi:hypothetical protein